MGISILKQVFQRVKFHAFVKNFQLQSEKLSGFLVLTCTFLVRLVAKFRKPSQSSCWTYLFNHSCFHLSVIFKNEVQLPALSCCKIWVWMCWQDLYLLSKFFLLFVNFSYQSHLKSFVQCNSVKLKEYWNLHWSNLNCK